MTGRIDPTSSNPLTTIGAAQLFGWEERPLLPERLSDA